MATRVDDARVGREGLAEEQQVAGRRGECCDEAEPVRRGRVLRWPEHRTSLLTRPGTVSSSLPKIALPMRALFPNHSPARTFEAPVVKAEGQH